jgi:hypothetical protein
MILSFIDGRRLFFEVLRLGYQAEDFQSLYCNSDEITKASSQGRSIILLQPFLKILRDWRS